MEKENSMGTEKVSRLVLKTGLPLMLSLLINSLYNFVDSVFVSRVAEDALTALSLAAPVQVLVSALGGARGEEAGRGQKNGQCGHFPGAVRVGADLHCLSSGHPLVL